MKEHAIKTEASRLKLLEKSVLHQQEQNEEVKDLHADHELELEKRLHMVQKREINLDHQEGLLAFRSAGKRQPEVDAANYRRQQDLQAMKKEYTTRLEDLNKAEQKWCKERNLPYVPITL